MYTRKPRFSSMPEIRRKPFFALYRERMRAFLPILLLTYYLDKIYIEAKSYLSFLPNREKWTYRFGCDFKSSSRLAAWAVVAFGLL